MKSLLSTFSLNAVVLTAVAALTALTACTPSLTHNSISANQQETSKLYSQIGSERDVTFDAFYLTNYTSLEDFNANVANVSPYTVMPVVQYLFGPLTYRSLGSPQKGESVALHPEQAVLVDGLVRVPYTYTAKWLINKSVDANQVLTLPLPFNTDVVLTANWKMCTDSTPEHQTTWFYWYFWDPTRPGCEHQLNVQYQMVDVKIGAETVQTAETFPEYKRMIHTVGDQQILASTHAFGYVEDNTDPKPFTDTDYGATQFRKFHAKTEKTLTALGFTKTPVKQSEYGGSDELIIGSHFDGVKDGIKMRITVVVNAGVDQMQLFAKSYAADHEAYFGWYGHSRVGSGFDAQQFAQIVASDPAKYSISSEYQLVYWAGCNSYSYYTQPFFKQKSKVDAADLHGTRNLDIISNGLPSLFSFNGHNATVLLNALMNTSTPTSYQSIIKSIEDYAAQSGTAVIANVLGDEDNVTK